MQQGRYYLVPARNCTELNTDLQSQASQETANRKNDDFQLFGAGMASELVKIEFSVLRIIALAPEDPVNKDGTCHIQVPYLLMSLNDGIFTQACGMLCTELEA